MGKRLQSFSAAGNSNYVESASRESRLQQLVHLLIVVDDEQATKIATGNVI